MRSAYNWITTVLFMLSKFVWNVRASIVRVLQGLSPYNECVMRDERWFNVINLSIQVHLFINLGLMLDNFYRQCKLYGQRLSIIKWSNCSFYIYIYTNKYNRKEAQPVSFYLSTLNARLSIFYEDADLIWNVPMFSTRTPS